MISHDELLEIVCQEAGLTKESILRRFRGRNFVLARYVYFHTARQLYGLKLSEIGLKFNCDHTTVIHGLRKVEDLLFIKDDICVSLVNRVKTRIQELNQTPIKVILSIPGHLDANKICADLVSQFNCSVERV
jgi:chromosomal replication initiation ATPase DnaA